MRRRLVILTEIIAPYRIPVFNALAELSEIDLHVIFLSATDPSLRQWRVYTEEIRFSHEILPSWRWRVGNYNLLLNRGVAAALRRVAPEAVLCGGYSCLAFWQAAIWSRRHRVPMLLWSESTVHDARRKHAPVELLKARFRKWCRAFVAAGESSVDYLISLGASRDSIFVAPDAVDVELYSTLAAKARQHPEEVRTRHQLPRRYFLCAGRVVREKGVFELLSAYAALDESVRSQVGLVFAGDGAARSQLQLLAGNIGAGSVRFSGFIQREQMPELYALAEALVFPTHSDPWGLVVNEAMACGLPIIASEVAGCVADLVEDGRNGFVVPARDIAGLTAAMQTVFHQPALRAEMAAVSLHRVQSFTPEAWAAGVAEAVSFACA
jgi:glycosyltransferase involved in cell wall biosynthesis